MPAQAETVTGLPAPDLTAVGATVSVTTSDGEAVNLGPGIPSLQKSQLPASVFFNMNEQAGITLENGDVLTGYENASADSMVYDTMFFGTRGGSYDFLLSAMADNNNPFGLTLGSASASARLTFEMEVTQPSLFTGDPFEVPVTVTGKTSGNGDTSFEVSVVDSTGKLIYDTGRFTAGDAIDESLFLTVGQVYTVTTQANVFVAGDGNANLSIDPLVEIDPNFASAKDYALYFSPGLFPAAPEASTWVMMVLGFSGLGFVGYRTSRKAASIAV